MRSYVLKRVVFMNRRLNGALYTRNFFRRKVHCSKGLLKTVSSGKLVFDFIFVSVLRYCFFQIVVKNFEKCLLETFLSKCQLLNVLS